MGVTASVRVKVCGVTNLDDALAAVEAGAAALGFNFHPPSPRFVESAAAAAIVSRVPRSVCTVGVFVNESRERVAAIAAQVGLTAVQFHGDESPAFCQAWKQKVVKAVRVQGPDAAQRARAYDVDFILADAYVEGQLGGTGRRVAVQFLGDFDRDRLIVAGGLTPENVAEVVRVVRPFAVDVASGVEYAPGKKDVALVRRFIARAHAA
jgi:phosphoribosylanthranilate isomerase